MSPNRSRVSVPTGVSDEPYRLFESITPDVRFFKLSRVLSLVMFALFCEHFPLKTSFPSQILIKIPSTSKKRRTPPFMLKHVFQNNTRKRRLYRYSSSLRRVSMTSKSSSTFHFFPQPKRRLTQAFACASIPWASARIANMCCLR